MVPEFVCVLVVISIHADAAMPVPLAAAVLSLQIYLVLIDHTYSLRSDAAEQRTCDPR